MAAPSTDPFEAFRKKKEQAKAAESASAQQEKVLGWVEGCGPGGEEKPEPGRPKGYIKGRFKKKDVKPEELEKLRPKKLDPTRLTPNETAPKGEDIEEREDIPPEKMRMPKKFTKF